MNQDIRNKLNHLVLLRANPLSDSNNIARLIRELEYINVANFTTQDIQLLNQATW